MANVEIKLNSAGVRELLKSAEIAGECERLANQVLGKCGGVEGYEVIERNHPQRARFAVCATTEHAARDNIHNQTLLKALGAK